MTQYKKDPPRWPKIHYKKESDRIKNLTIEDRLSYALNTVSCLEMAFSGGGDWKYNQKYLEDIQSIKDQLKRIWDLIPDEK